MPATLATVFWHPITLPIIATGEATIQEVGEQIFHMILEVASGRKQTWADHWGLHNEFALFNPAPIT